MSKYLKNELHSHQPQLYFVFGKNNGPPWRSTKRSKSCYCLDKSYRITLLDHYQNNGTSQAGNRDCDQIFSVGWFCLYLFTFWQISTFKGMPNELLGVPICSVPISVQTNVTGLLWYWKKPKNVMILSFYSQFNKAKKYKEIGPPGCIHKVLAWLWSLPLTNSNLYFVRLASSFVHLEQKNKH